MVTPLLTLGLQMDLVFYTWYFQNNSANGASPAISTFNFSSSDGVTCSEGSTLGFSLLWCFNYYIYIPQR